MEKIFTRSLTVSLISMGGAAISFLLERTSETSLTEMSGIIGIIGITVFVAVFSGAHLIDWLQQRHSSNAKKSMTIAENVKAYSLIASSLIFVGIAFIIELATSISPISSFAMTSPAIGWGVAATFPMLLILVVLEKIKHPSIISFRDNQIKYFAGLGFRFTPLRILLMSLGAGIGEELLFRGALQGWLATHLPIALAVLLPAIVFGLMHSANRIYMLIAGLIGVYLGMLFVISGNILAPIIAHTLYDIIALAYTEKLIRKMERSQ